MNSSFLRVYPLGLFLAWACVAGSEAWAGWIWVEGEKPAENRMNRHPWWYDRVKTNQFSGGDFISNFDKDKPGEAVYRFSAARAGDYEFWVRANPLSSKLSYALNGGPETPIDLNREKLGEVNVAADDKPDLRFLAWSKAGKVSLREGVNTIRFRMTSDNSHHGYLDCFVFSEEPFRPRGLLKPDQLADESRRWAAEHGAWFAFDPQSEVPPNSAIDLRFLNEKFAGENGFITVKGSRFVHSQTGEPIRFWAVNGPPHDLSGADLKRCARLLAAYGVNLVRIHGGYFDPKGEVDLKKVRHAIEIVQAMKAEGIYSYFSIYFPLWITPAPETPWVKGYDGKSHPFAALEFNPDFQAQYRKWWTALLTTPGETTGKPLAEEPAVAGLEMQNEDSFFFWTFAEERIPDPQLRIIEKLFGDWLVKRYGSLPAALAKWNGVKAKRDAIAEGRVGFRPLWNMFSEKTARDQDAARFLLEVQTQFYSETRAFLRKLGFKGPITASNWSTASPEVLGPLEKLSYTCGDFLDRHGYFSCNHKGEEAGWSLRNGHTYEDRSAYRFDAETAGQPKQFVHPAMDVHYQGKPSMISEITWNRPNRFRSEAPIYLAAYGALQNSDAIVHFAFDGKAWAVKPGFWMQPWTLMSPAMMGQFPAAALIYRRGLVAPGQVVASLRLSKEALLRLEGTPLPQEAALDELRLKDVPPGQELKPGARLDPLLHYAGQSEVEFVDGPGSAQVADLKPYLDRAAKTVSSTTGELKLDYGRGVLVIDAPRAQGISGLIGAAGRRETKDLVLESGMELGNILAVALDDQPIAKSRKILLQVMSEEKASEFETEPAGGSLKRIVSIGTDPWLVRKLEGTVKFKRPDAASLKVTALNSNGLPAGSAGSADNLRLQPQTIYYLVQAP